MMMFALTSSQFEDNWATLTKIFKDVWKHNLTKRQSDLFCYY